MEEKSENNPVPGRLPMHLSPRCKARTRSGAPCLQAAMANGRCRMHGGPSPGAPRGNSNAVTHGRFTREAKATRRLLAALVYEAKQLVEEVDGA
jgi:hypothetical protein